MNRITAITGMLFFASAICAQTEVATGTANGKDFGAVYSLPQTVLEVEVKVVKVSYTPGSFSKYAERYLRMTDVSHDAKEYWEFAGVNVRALGVPDSERTYFVKMKDKTVAPLIELTEDGIIKSINVPYEKNREEAVTGGSKSAAAAGKKRPDPRKFLTEEILTANSSAKMAELTAKEIYNIRDSKNALLRGQADNMPKDGAQLKLMIDSMNEQEEAMLTMFSGIEERDERTYTLRIVPDREMTDEVIFRFSTKLGPVEADNLAGEPVYMSLTDMKTVTIPLEADKKKKLEGIAYNEPGRARVTVIKKEFSESKAKELFKGEFSITQFGTIEYLAPMLFNNKSTIQVTFDAVTGRYIKVDRGEKK